MAKSIKVNPNILECGDDFTTDKLKQLIVPQGCFCYPGVECNKVLDEKKNFIKSDTDCNIELDNLVQFSLKDKKLYFSTNRIAVIVVKSLRTTEDIAKNWGTFYYNDEEKTWLPKEKGKRGREQQYMMSRSYIKKNIVRKQSIKTSRSKRGMSRKSKPQSGKSKPTTNNKPIHVVAKRDIKFIYSIFKKGYIPLLIFERGDLWMPFMERAQIINSALHLQAVNKLCGLPMNAIFINKYGEDEEDEEKYDEKQGSVQIKKITENIKDLKDTFATVKELGNQEFRDMGGDPFNVLSLLYKDSEVARELSHPLPKDKPFGFQYKQRSSYLRRIQTAASYMEVWFWGSIKVARIYGLNSHL